MFNIYYVNYAKAYEIAMLLDNKVLEQITKEKESNGSAEGMVDVATESIGEIPFIGKYMPKLDINSQLIGTKSSKVIDTVKVISTKSTILDRIYKKAKEVTKLQDKTIGNLIKIKNVSLEVKNENDILGAKTMLSGAFGDIAVDGVGNVNLPTLLEVMFKDSAYILEGKIPKERFKKEERIIIKIPMMPENELENQYSISDLEIGKVTIIGIYRGCYDNAVLDKKLSRFSQKENITGDFDAGIESDEQNINETKVHYIDVISIVQDIWF